MKLKRGRIRKNLSLACILSFSNMKQLYVLLVDGRLRQTLEELVDIKYSSARILIVFFFVCVLFCFLLFFFFSFDHS